MILASVQGLAELLPVSSSAHVIAAEKLMGLDPTSPQMTMLLVMLHAGTMLAVIVHFWREWRNIYFTSLSSFRAHAARLLIASAATGVVAIALMLLIKFALARSDNFEIEQLFGNAKLIAGALAAAGILIIASSRLQEGQAQEIPLRTALWIGAVQGLCLPFRGFSRSGATISTGLALGLARHRAEEFSFALAVVLTPAVISQEGHRLLKANTAAADVGSLWQIFGPSLLGMAFSFGAGLIALRWLARWLEGGRWHLFGFYCLTAAAAMIWIG